MICIAVSETFSCCSFSSSHSVLTKFGNSWDCIQTKPHTSDKHGFRFLVWRGPGTRVWRHSSIQHIKSCPECINADHARRRNRRGRRSTGNLPRRCGYTYVYAAKWVWHSHTRDRCERCLVRSHESRAVPFRALLQSEARDRLVNSGWRHRFFASQCQLGAKSSARALMSFCITAMSALEFRNTDSSRGFSKKSLCDSSRCNDYRYV